MKMEMPIATIILKASLIALGTLGHNFFLSIRYRKPKNIAEKTHIINENVPLPTIYTAIEYNAERMAKSAYINLNLRITLSLSSIMYYI